MIVETSQEDIEENLHKIYFTYLSPNYSDMKKNNGFNEVVIQKYDSTMITQNIG